jgi:hypothetical protein
MPHMLPAPSSAQAYTANMTFSYEITCFYDRGIMPIIPITDINECLMV